MNRDLIGDRPEINKAFLEQYKGNLYYSPVHAEHCSDVPIPVHPCQPHTDWMIFSRETLDQFPDRLFVLETRTDEEIRLSCMNAAAQAQKMADSVRTQSRIN